MVGRWYPVFSTIETFMNGGMVVSHLDINSTSANESALLFTVHGSVYVEVIYCNTRFHKT